MGTTDIFKGLRDAISYDFRVPWHTHDRAISAGFDKVVDHQQAASEPGSEISHFPNSLPSLWEQPQLLSYSQLSDGWWCECHKKRCSLAKKAKGRI